jgi:hypothetical protein
MAGYESKVYWNTGEHGGKANHWLHLTFTGLQDAELIGARVEVSTKSAMIPLRGLCQEASPAWGRGSASSRDPKSAMTQFRWIHPNHSYKSGGALDAHFGLGQATSAEVKVKLLDGREITFPAIKADKSHPLDFAKPIKIKP